MLKSSLAVFGLVLLLALSGCGNKPKLNIPETPPRDALQPDLTAANLVRMGQRVEAAGDYNSAGNFYSDAIQMDGTLIEAHLGLGRVLEIIGQDRAAALSFGRAWALDPGNQEYLRKYIRLLLQNEGEALAIEALNAYLETYQPTPEILNFKGIAHDLAGDFLTAEAAYRQGLTLAQSGTRWPSTLLGNLALSLGLAGETSEAVLLLNPYIGDMRLGLDQLTQEQSNLRQNLALVYALSGNTESAVEVAKSALSAEDAEYNRGFYEAVAGLRGAARAKAVFLGELPEPTGP